MDHIDNLLRWMKGLPGTDTPHGLAAYKATAVLLGILITWLLLKWFLQRLSRRLLRYPFFKENENVLKAIRKAWGIALFGALGPFLMAYYLTLTFWDDQQMALMCGLAMTATAGKPY